MAGIVVLGVFVADAAYRTDRFPRMGETVLGHAFALGPGGKGSNQAVAAARLGGDVTMLTRLGDDAFADLAEQTWAKAGVRSAAVRDPQSYTGSAAILIDHATGDNAIIVSPGAGGTLSAAHMDEHRATIAEASVAMTQLEQPLEAAERFFAIAREMGATTILNPAPAADLPDAFLATCDWITPNESEAEALTRIEVASEDGARRAADALLERGVGTKGGVVVTLGERGVLLHTKSASVVVPAFRAGDVVETTGAGDAFNGGFAVGLASGLAPADAARLGCATAGLSVTKAGAAASMPTRDEVDALLSSLTEV